MSTDARRYQEDVVLHGFSPTHLQIIEWVPKGARVLELGCASGYIGHALATQKGCIVTGVEVDAGAAAVAREKGLTILEGSLESPAFRASIEGPFDVVIAADVLEHLADPAPVLDHVKRWLAPGGVAIVAVPNIATWTMRMKLLRGQWEYEETGILDRTHLHFFTWETLHRLVRSQGWQIEGTMVDGWELPGLQTVLFELPHRTMIRTNKFAEVKDWAARKRQKSVYLFAENLYKIGRSLGKVLIRKWPNLAAPHVALLLCLPST